MSMALRKEKMDFSQEPGMTDMESFTASRISFFFTFILTTLITGVQLLKT
jgi:hypothetical protein